MKIKQLILFVTIGFLSIFSLSKTSYSLDKKCLGQKWILKKKAATKTIIKGKDKVRDFFLNKDEISWCGKKGLIDSLAKYKYIAGTKYTNIEAVNLTADGKIKIQLKSEKRSRSTLVLSKCKDTKKNCSTSVAIHSFYEKIKTHLQGITNSQTLVELIKSSPYARSLIQEEKLFSSIPVYSIRVLTQDAPGTVGGSWTCAYNSLKNSLSFAKVLQKHKKTGTLNFNDIKNLKISLQSVSPFNLAFIGRDGSLRSPKERSWFHFAKNNALNFRFSDGLFPGDQRQLLKAMEAGTVENYRGINQRNLREILPNFIQLNGLSDEIISSDDYIPLIKKLSDFNSKKTNFVFFTVGQITREHFIALVLNRNKKGKKEIFILDSMNSRISQNRGEVNVLINWLLGFSTKAISYYRKLYGNEADDGSLNTTIHRSEQAPLDRYFRNIKIVETGTVIPGVTIARMKAGPGDQARWYHDNFPQERSILLKIHEARQVLKIIEKLPGVKKSWLIAQYGKLKPLLLFFQNHFKGHHTLFVNRVPIREQTKGVIPVTTQEEFDLLLKRWIREIQTKQNRLTWRLVR